jgi:hypothetical protein
MTLQFWQGWPRSNRILFLTFLGVFAAALAIMWVAFFMQPSPTIELKTISEADISEIIVDQFSKGPFDFTVRGNNYVILQRQLGSTLTPNEVVSYIYLVALAAFVIGMLAVISTLGRFYYLAGMGVFILFVTTLSPEMLGVFGYGKVFSVVIMAMYGLASFWFFYFATTATFTKRVLLFTVVTVCIWGLIYFFSLTPKPFTFLAASSAEAGLIACGLFIVTVSHEIIAAFVFAATQSPRQRKSLNHFLWITLIYMINLALAYSVRFGFIKWNLITIDLFLLLTISGILGIWGIRQRQKTFEGIIDGDPYAVYAFLFTGALTFVTIGMFMLNANDTALSAISDIIIFTHLGFGLIFLMYVFSNFAGMLAQNFQVYKVLYQPNNMPFFTFRLAGLIATLALVFYNAWQVPAHNAVSGFKNGIADAYLEIGNTAIAKAIYDESRTYGFHGHHASYARANIEGSLFNINEERNFYAQASGPRPTQMSYLNWAQSYQAVGDNTKAIQTLTEGVGRLKDHSALENTLGLLYARAGFPDSASKYLSRSNISSNLTGLAALGYIPVPNDSLDSVNGTGVNDLALANLLREPITTFQLPTDTALTLVQAASISNYIINARGNEDTTFIKKVISLARRPSNSGFKEALLMASAISLYSSGETKDAFTTLEEVTVGSDHRGRYNNMLTMWALENNEPERAVGYAEYAVTQHYEPANVTYAVALTESNKLREATTEWDSLRVKGDSITMLLANQVYHALTQAPGALTNEELSAYIKYRRTTADSAEIFSLINRFGDNDDAKAKILLDLAQKLHAIDKPSAAINVLRRIVGLELTDAAVGRQMQILEMLCSSRAATLNALKQNPLEFKGKEKKYRIYFQALAAEAAGDSTNANIYFTWLANANPYFDDGLIAAANYFSNKPHKSYNILAEGLLYHPSSLKVRKAYALAAARVGFEDYANGSLEALKEMIDLKDYAELSKKIEELLRGRR